MQGQKPAGIHTHSQTATHSQAHSSTHSTHTATHTIIETHTSSWMHTHSVTQSHVQSQRVVPSVTDSHLIWEKAPHTHLHSHKHTHTLTYIAVPPPHKITNAGSQSPDPGGHNWSHGVPLDHRVPDSSLALLPPPPGPSLYIPSSPSGAAAGLGPSW